MRFYWTGMKEQCEKIAREALPNQLERAKYPAPRWLHPCQKGVRPFGEWVLDTMTGLYPPGERGETCVAMAVDAFTKFVVSDAVPDLNAATMAAWFHRRLTC